MRTKNGKSGFSLQNRDWMDMIGEPKSLPGDSGMRVLKSSTQDSIKHRSRSSLPQSRKIRMELDYPVLQALMTISSPGSSNF